MRIKHLGKAHHQARRIARIHAHIVNDYVKGVWVRGQVRFRGHTLVAHPAIFSQTRVQIAGIIRCDILLQRAQNPRPAPRCCAQIHRGHAGSKALIPLLARDEVMPGFFELECRTTGGFTGKLQTRNAHRPHRTVIRFCQPQKNFPAALEGQQQTRLRGL